jgi:hypothetical protein
MKSRVALLLALGACFAHGAAAASPFKIYFNAEDASHCAVNGVTSASLLPDGNMLALTSANPPVLSSACGTTSSGTTPTVSLAITPASVDAGVPQSATLTWTANNVSTCDITGTDASVATEFSNAWTNATVACGGTPNHCAGGNNVVTLTPLAAGSDGTYNFGLRCSSGANGAFATSTLAVTGSSGPPAGEACTNGMASPDANLSTYTARCSGTMKFFRGGTTTTSGSYSFDFVFGGPWPGTNEGGTMQIVIGKNQFLSIPFTPSPGHTIGIQENESYNGPFPVTFSISTSPGKFNNAKAGNGVVCAQSSLPVLTMTSNGTAGQKCNLSAGTQYWFNIIPAAYNSKSSTWVNNCASSTNCSLGFGQTQTN